MKALLFALALTACDGSTVVTSTSASPCDYQLYQTLECDSGYSWSPGYYNSYHVYVTPRYVRRTTVIHVSSPTIVDHRTTVVRTASPARVTTKRVTTTTKRTSVRTTVRRR